MPIRYKVHGDLGVFVVTCSGVITLKEILGLLDSIETDPLILDGMHKLLDCRAIETVMVSEAEMTGVADLIQSIDKRRSKVTPMTVFAPVGAGYEAGSFYASQFSDASPTKVLVFRTFAEAALNAGFDRAELGARMEPPITP